MRPCSAQFQARKTQMEKTVHVALLGLLGYFQHTLFSFLLSLNLRV